jgi:hypothetical protein
MIHAKCKKMAQHKLYNEGVVDVPCTCFSCVAKLTIPIDDDICNCSGCVPETIPPIPKPPPPPTVLSTIPHSDRISAQARTHSKMALAKFCKQVWREDGQNFILPPEVYMPNHVIKEILDRFSQMTSLAMVEAFLHPYKRLEHQAHALLEVLRELKVDFDAFAAAKKADNVAKCKAASAAKAEEKWAERHADKTVDSMTIDDDMTDGVGSSKSADEDKVAAGPSHESTPTKTSQAGKAKRAQRAPMLGTKEVSVTYGPQRTLRRRGS